MDFVNKVIGSVTPSSEDKKPKPETKSTEHSAAGNTKDTAGDGVGKVAGGTGDLLSSAKERGNLDETKGVGKAVDQAEVRARSIEATHAGEEKKNDAAGGLSK